MINKICILKYIFNATNKEIIKLYDNILNNIESSFTSENYNTSNLENGNDEIIELNQMKIILTTSENQNNKIKENISTIYLNQCEV